MDTIYTLDAIELAQDGTAPDSIWIANVGTYFHPKKGKFTLSDTVMRSMVDSFNAAVSRGRDKPVPIDIDHASVRQPPGPLRRAMGWIKSLSFDGKTLRGNVEWTDEGAGLVASKGFRYTSPVVLMNQEDTANGDILPAVLHSVALTNQPVLPDGEPIVASKNLTHESIVVCQDVSETRSEDRDTPEEEIRMKEITLSIDGADETVSVDENSAEAIEKIAAEAADLKQRVAALEAEKAEAVEKAEALAASQVPEDAIVLSRDEVTALKASAEKVDAMEKELAIERAARAEEKAEKRISLAMSKGQLDRAMITDFVREAARGSEEDWENILSLRPEGSAWEPGVRGINTPEPPAKPENAQSAAMQVIENFAEKNEVSFSAALDKLAATAGAELDDNDRQSLVAAGIFRS